MLALLKGQAGELLDDSLRAQGFRALKGQQAILLVQVCEASSVSVKGAVVVVCERLQGRALSAMCR